MDQCGSSIHRKFAVLDKNKDLYLVSIHDGKNTRNVKLGKLNHNVIFLKMHLTITQNKETLLGKVEVHGNM